MGVTGLWKLIESSGRPVAFETLEDKVIVIDISIWLHQVVKGYQDGKGGQVHNAHLIGLFNRICKLLYFRIKPIFVFDGKVCSLKYDTIAKRAQQKSKLKTESEKLEELLLQSLAKEKIIKEALGIDTKNLIISPKKKSNLPKVVEEKDDMFKLPAIDDLPHAKLEIKDEDDELGCPKKSYNLNISKIDLNSSYFKSLAPDIRHEILMDIKETRKQSNWSRMKDLPVEQENFSSYQMAGLLRRRQVQVNLEEAEKEMGGKVFSLSELESLLAEDGVLQVGAKHAQPISGDEKTRFLLVKDIAKAISDAKDREETAKKEPQPSTSKGIVAVKNENDFDDDHDLELQKAIQMSLENDATEIIDNDEPRKLSALQRKKFIGSIQSHGLVKGFMKEYGEMNDDDIQDFIETTQIENEQETKDESLTQKFPHTDRYVLYGTPEKSIVEESPKSVEPEKQEIVITVSSTNYSQEEDIFADIFEKKPEEPQQDKILDVEVASISDDDTIEYDIPAEDFTEVDESEELKEVESESISEEGKHFQNSIKDAIIEIESDESENEVPCSENQKFWNILDDIEEQNRDRIKEKTPEKSQNQKFYEIEDSSNEGIVEEIQNGQTTSAKHIPAPEIDSEKVSPIVIPQKSTPVKIDDEMNSTENEKIQDKSPEKSSIQQKSDEEEILLAAQALRMEMNNDELQKMELDVMKQQKEYEYEKNKLNRFGTSITDSMSRDCKELLRLFGIPYIDAPFEAEAQCAFLNAAKLADGIISDDSDVWLFGAKTVYKNFFLQKKVVQKFEIQDIMDKFKIDRKTLVLIAMFVGSDYTLGIHGIGTVTALEILAEFPPTPEENGTDIYQSMLSSLRKFRDWFENKKQDVTGTKKGLKSKLRNVEISTGFPNLNVVKAYMEPNVNESLDNFSWGVPDVESIIEFLRVKIGWTRIKTQEILNPVMKRFNERKQKKIEDYFKIQLQKKQFDTQKMSKRVQKAIGKMSGNVQELEEPTEKKPRKRKVNNKKTLSAKEKKEVKAIEDAVLCLSEDDDEPPEKRSSPEKRDEPSTSTSSPQKINAFDLLQSPQKPKQAAPKTRKRKTKAENDSKSSKADDEALLPPKRPPRIPETKQVIPQREKDLKEQEQNKQKAIEIFKKAQKKK